MTNLARNFSLEEFTRSQVASRLGIENKPGEFEEMNLIRTAGWLQTLRDRLNEHYQRPISITILSGYRSHRLNKEVKGAKNSAHKEGLAADIAATGLTAGQLYDFILEHMDDEPFDQVINEYDRWVHIGLADLCAIPRGQALIARLVRSMTGKMKTKYVSDGSISFEY